VYDEQILIVSLGEDEESIKIAEALRKKENCLIFYGKPSKALDYANSLGINRVMFVGKQELSKNVVKVKDMKTGKESFLKINELLKDGKVNMPNL